MRSKSFAFLAVTTAALLFGALTDDASSHKLSSLAVRAFDGAVGTAIELVRPSATEKRAEQQSTTSARPAPAPRSGSELQSPLFARANPVETTSFETTLPSGGPATVTERKTEEDEDVASRTSGAANFGVRGVRPAFGGGLSGSAGNQDASIAPAATTETPADSSNLRLDGLMDLVASDLDRDYGAPTGASPLDFTKPSKATAPSGSPSGSTSIRRLLSQAPVRRRRRPRGQTPALWSRLSNLLRPAPILELSSHQRSARPLRLCRPPTSARAPQAPQAIRPKGPLRLLYRSTSSPTSVWMGSFRIRQFHRLIWSMTL